jgi:hypothetical protein
MKKVLQEEIERINQLMNVNEDNNLLYLKRRLSSENLGISYKGALAYATKKLIEYKGTKNKIGLEKFKDIIISVTLDSFFNDFIVSGREIPDDLSYDDASNYLRQSLDDEMEERYNKLINIQEQISDTRFPVRGLSDAENRKILYGTPEEQQAVINLMELGASMLPVVGPFLAVAFGAYHTQDEWEKGNKKTAGLIAVLSMLPFIGKIPIVKKLGEKGIALLASKLTKGGKNLSSTEIEVVRALKENESLITQDLSSANKILGELTESLNKLKPNYIKQFGQQSYEELLQKLLSKKITKKEFIETLKQSKSKNYLGGSTRGIKMSAQELTKVSELASKIKKGQYFKEVIEINVNGKNVKCLVTVESMPGKTVGYAQNTFYKGHNIPGININGDYVKTWSIQDVRKSLYHELTHVKDIGKQEKGLEFLEKAREYYDKANELKLNTPEGSPLPKDYDELISKTKNLYNKYLFSPEEFIANNQMIINNIVSKSNDLFKNLGKVNGKNRINRMLDNIIDYTKSKTPLSKESASLFSKEGLEYLTGLYSYDKKMYQNFVKKMTLQIQDLKTRFN